MSATNTKSAPQNKTATERDVAPAAVSRKPKTRVSLTVAHIYAENCDAATVVAIVDELLRLIETRRTA